MQNSITKRQKLETSDLTPSVFLHELEELLASTKQSSPVLADLSTYNHSINLLNRAEQFFSPVGLARDHKAVVFANTCAVFSKWLQDTNCFSKELLLAVWLADSIWRCACDMMALLQHPATLGVLAGTHCHMCRWRKSVVLETPRFLVAPWPTQHTDAGHALQQVRAHFACKFQVIMPAAIRNNYCCLSLYRALLLAKSGEACGYHVHTP